MGLVSVGLAMQASTTVRRLAGPQDPSDNVTTVDEVVITGIKSSESDSAGFWRDFFGFDSGSFRLSDFGLDFSHAGEVEVSIGGVTGGFPVNPDDSPTIGASAGLDVDPSDGRVPVGLSNGISYNPDPSTGLSTDGLSASYLINVPSPHGGLGYYPVPGGDGETSFGPPPGSGLGPPSEPYGF
jgi:hypothetical protein